MPIAPDPLLPLAVGVLLGAGLLAAALASVAGRVTVTLLVAFAWLTAGGLLARHLDALLALGGWARVDENAYTGAALVFTGPVELWADPLGLLLAGALHLSGGALLLGAAAVWGGGKRRENAPMRSGQIGGGLAILALVEALALTRDVDQALVLFVLSSTTGGLLLLSARGRLDGLAAAGRVFVVHRVGDLGLLLAAALLLAAFDTLALDPLIEALRTTPIYTRGEGALDGYPARWLYGAAVFGLLFALGTRLAWLPFSGFMKDTEEAPMPALGLVHGLAFLGAGLIFALKLGPLWPLAPGLTHGAAILAAGSAVVLAVSSLATDDVVVAALRLLYGLGALVGGVVLEGQLPTAVIGLLLLLLLLPAWLMPFGAAVEALQGRTSLAAMGGLWRALRKSDALLALTTTAAVGVPGFAGFFFFERAAFGALVAARPDPGGAALTLLFVFLFSLGAWRLLHRAFSGDTPPEDSPAVLVEPGLVRFFLPFVVGAVILTGGVLALTPEALVHPFAPDYFAPFDTFVYPSMGALYSTLVVVEDRSSLGLPGGARFAIMGAVVALALCGYALSAFLFRKGGHARAQGLTDKPALQKIAAALDGGLGLQAAADLLIAVPLSQASRMLAGVVFPVLVEGPLSRIPAWGAGVLQFALRLVHSGDVQRSIAWVGIGLAAGLLLWGAS